MRGVAGPGPDVMVEAGVAVDSGGAVAPGGVVRVATVVAVCKPGWRSAVADGPAAVWPGEAAGASQAAEISRPRARSAAWAAGRRANG